MTTCLRCHRPLKRPTESGYGRVCEKLAKPVPEIDRDLFGIDIELCALAALAHLELFIVNRAWQEKAAISEGFRQARERLGVSP